jgi:hypothetical protein
VRERRRVSSVLQASAATFAAIAFHTERKYAGTIPYPLAWPRPITHVNSTMAKCGIVLALWSSGVGEA